MRRFLIAFISLAAFAASALLLPPASQAQTNIPRLDYRERTLANGLKIYSVEDHSSPTVAIQVWYHVGSKDDPPGRSGFAHLFEHLMFKSTKHMKSEMLDRLTEDVGGVNNAFTADDVTVYYETVPSNYLETLLWAEADRLATLNVDDPNWRCCINLYIAVSGLKFDGSSTIYGHKTLFMQQSHPNFKSERAVVQEEFRQSVLAPPYGKLDYLLTSQKSYVTHPYKRPTIGSIEDLDAATLADVRLFHDTFYRPSNATLIVAGDFDRNQLDAWVNKYFTGIQNPNTTLPRVTIKEPARTALHRYTEYGANVPLPAVEFTYLIPPKADADIYALRVAQSILAGGESSRLYRSLVYEQQLAQSAEGSADLREDAGLFVFKTTLASGKKPDDAERAMLAEISRMQNEPVTLAELNKAKNQLVTTQLRERETNNGKALALGDAVVIQGNANRVNTDINQLQSVTAADVQRVMRKYFTEANRVVINYLSETERTAQNDSDNPTPTNNRVPDTVGNPAQTPQQRKPIVINAGVLNGKAKDKPIPTYPDEAKKAGIYGTVAVKILVDEQGNVVAARAISGPPSLRKAAEEGALHTKFSPTLLAGKPVKVSGTISFNFKPK
ncbi:MAG: TonB family protein [Pyrinomonadaceae bacterium]